LEKITALLKSAPKKFSTADKMGFKNLFGAVGGYVNGKIFISCGSFGVALRLPPEALGELFKEKGVKHLKYFPKGHVKKEYAVLPKRILDDAGQLGKLLNKSMEYASTP